MKTTSAEKLIRDNKRLKRQCILLKKENTQLERQLKISELTMRDYQNNVAVLEDRLRKAEPELYDYAKGM